MKKLEDSSLTVLKILKNINYEKEETNTQSAIGNWQK